MKLLDRLTLGWLPHTKVECMGGNPPFYDNERYGGPGGIRYPQEAGNSTFDVIKESDITTLHGIVGGTYTLTPSESMASLLTFTPTSNLTIIYPACNPGLSVTIQNLASATYTITVQAGTNSSNTAVIAANTVGQIVHTGYNSGIMLIGGGGGSGSFTNVTASGTLAVTGNSTVGGTLGVTGLLSAVNAALSGTLTWKPTIQTAAGATDVVLFASALNVCIFTSTGPDAATLATPGSADAGKILILINTNTTQNAVTTAANKILNGTASTYDTLTAPAHAGAVAILFASNGFWNVLVGGTGTWVLSEV